MLPSDRTRVSGHKLICGTFFLNTWKHFVYCERDWALTESSQRGCGVFILGDIQNLSGHGPGQPALGGPVWTDVLDQTTSTGPFQSQLFRDSVNWMFRNFVQNVKQVPAPWVNVSAFENLAYPLWLRMTNIWEYVLKALWGIISLPDVAVSRVDPRTLWYLSLGGRAKSFEWEVSVLRRRYALRLLT